MIKCKSIATKMIEGFLQTVGDGLRWSASYLCLVKLLEFLRCQGSSVSACELPHSKKAYRQRPSPPDMHRQSKLIRCDENGRGSNFEGQCEIRLWVQGVELRRSSKVAKFEKGVRGKPTRGYGKHKQNQ